MVSFPESSQFAGSPREPSEDHVFADKSHIGRPDHHDCTGTFAANSLAEYRRLIDLGTLRKPRQQYHQAISSLGRSYAKDSCIATPGEHSCTPGEDYTRHAYQTDSVHRSESTSSTLDSRLPLLDESEHRPGIDSESSENMTNYALFIAHAPY